jgi:hypothetical protein
VSGDVAGGVGKNESGEVAHSVEKTGFTTIVSDVDRRPKVDMQDAERAAEGPGEDEFAVARDSAIGGDAVGILKDPIGDILAALRLEEAKANAMKSLVNTHVAGRGRSVVG